MRQSMGSCPVSVKKALALEKWPQPKKPRLAERGLGWGAVSTRWWGLVISRCLLWAGRPQRRKTTGVSLSLSSSKTLSVNLSQPLP